MRWCTVFSLVVLVSVLIGCSSTNDVVGRGPIQKRKYRSGWHLDIARPSNHSGPLEHKGPVTVGPGSVSELPVADQASIDPSLTSEVAEDAPETMTVVQASQPRGPKGSDHVPYEEPIAPQSVRPAGDPSPAMDDDGPRYWNRMTIVSAIFLLILATMLITWHGGGIFLYILFFTFLTGLIGLLLAIKHNEKGKAIAILAIALSVLIGALFFETLGTPD